MEQERAVNKVLRDLISAGLVSETWQGEVRLYLNQLFAAGYDEGNHRQYASHEREIVLYNGNDKEIGRWRSMAEASRETKTPQSTITMGMWRGTRSRNGNTWKYAENGKD